MQRCQHKNALCYNHFNAWKHESITPTIDYTRVTSKTFYQASSLVHSLIAPKKRLKTECQSQRIQTKTQPQEGRINLNRPTRNQTKHLELFKARNPRKLAERHRPHELRPLGAKERINEKND